MVRVLISADSKFPISRPMIKDGVKALLEERRVSSDTEVSVLVCGTRKSRELAEKYLGDTEPHNVLSFPLADETAEFAFATGKNVKGFVESQEGVLVLGDVIVCYPLAQEEANRDNMRINEKIVELVRHGVLHLLGEHHD